MCVFYVCFFLSVCECCCFILEGDVLLFKFWKLLVVVMELLVVSIFFFGLCMV